MITLEYLSSLGARAHRTLKKYLKNQILFRIDYFIKGIKEIHFKAQ